MYWGAQRRRGVTMSKRHGRLPHIQRARDFEHVFIRIYYPQVPATYVLLDLDPLCLKAALFSNLRGHPVENDTSLTPLTSTNQP